MRDFLARWGYSYKHIMIMPRVDFCNVHGDKYLNMNYCQFRRTLKRETPLIVLMPVGTNGHSWKHDRLVNKIEHISCQLGSWDNSGDGDIL